jgi:hypothetical protein
MRLRGFDVRLMIWQQRNSQTRFDDRTTTCCVKHARRARKPAILKVSPHTEHKAPLQ